MENRDKFKNIYKAEEMRIVGADRKGENLVEIQYDNSLKIIAYGHRLFTRLPELSRVESNMADGFFCISACRQDDSADMNNGRTVDLTDDLRSRSLRYVSLFGHNVVKENNNSNRKWDYADIVLFVPFKPDAMAEEKFAKYVYSLASDYEQEGYLLSLPSMDLKVGYYSGGPNDYKLDWVMDKMQNAKDLNKIYSRVKSKNGKDVEWVFEGYRYADSMMVAMSHVGEIKEG